MKHLRYLTYVLRHKWFVLLECAKLGIWWRGLLHDWSKFSLYEWSAYADHFYGRRRVTQLDKTGYYKPTDTGDPAFDAAWLHHVNMSPHHWQYWTQLAYDESIKVFDMPELCILEMVADWRGAGRAQGTPNVEAWYRKNCGRMNLTPATRKRVHEILGIAE